MELRVRTWLLLLWVLAGCSATANVKVKGGDGEPPKDFDTPIDSSSSFQDEDEDDEDEVQEPALLGARQDLFFNGPATTQCKCLAVVVGQGPNPAFGWENRAPDTDPGTQLVVALDATKCDAADVGAGISYRGYRVDGPNVVVQIEPAHPGRPKTVGAIIPKPFDDGSVFVEGAKGMVHGQAPSGKGLCAIGNPGPRRDSVNLSATPGDGKTKQIFEPTKKEVRESYEPDVPADAAEPEGKDRDPKPGR